MMRRLAPVLLGIACLLAPFSARAAVLLALDLAELVSRAEHVLVVEAVAEQARWSADGRQIVTDIELRTEQAVKGPRRAGQTVVATRLGGTMGEVALQVPGEARLKAGQRALVFLRANGGELRFVGMAQGVIAVSGTGAEAMAMPNTGGMALVERDDDGALVPARPAVHAPRKLDGLVTEIRRLAAGTGSLPAR